MLKCEQIFSCLIPVLEILKYQVSSYPWQNYVHNENIRRQNTWMTDIG